MLSVIKRCEQAKCYREVQSCKIASGDLPVRKRRLFSDVFRDKGETMRGGPHRFRIILLQSQSPRTGSSFRSAAHDIDAPYGESE